MRYFALFAGIGGLDYGLDGVGAECVGFSEVKDSSIRIYLRAFPGRRNYGDIRRVGPDELPDFDVLTGGFPCQSFSLAGLRRGLGDKRGQMVFYIYDILEAKRPRWAVFENVMGILSHDNGRTYDKVFRLFAAAGYFVRCVMLNAAHQGSAQSRERVFFLLRRGDDFPVFRPWRTDDTKRFRDVRDRDPLRFSWWARSREPDEGMFGVEIIGGYDRVGTIMTARQPKLVQESDGRFRYLTEVEAERLQGFPDGFTDGESRADRWFALGNAVNRRVSEYLFVEYLPRVWTDFPKASAVR